MQITKGKISFWTELQWTTKGVVITDDVVNEHLINKSNPYYVVISNNEFGGIIGHVSSSTKIKNGYCAASFAIDILREDIEDSFILIHEIDKTSKNFYVLNYSSGQIEFDGVMNIDDISKLVERVKDFSKIFISSGFEKHMGGEVNYKFFDFFEQAEDGLPSEHRLRGLSELAGKIKDTVKWVLILGGLAYLGWVNKDLFFEEEKVVSGPSQAQLASEKAKQDRLEQERYIAEQVRKRTGGISPIVAYDICRNLIREMPVNIAGWDAGPYSCNRTNEFKQSISAASQGYNRVKFSADPEVFKEQASKLGVSANVMYDEARSAFSAIVIKANKIESGDRDALKHSDLVGFNQVMNQVNFEFINGVDSSCTVKRVKAALGPLAPDKPIPPDLQVFITDIDVSCNNVYLEQLRDQLNVLNRRDINFVYFNLLKSNFTAKYQFISNS